MEKADRIAEGATPDDAPTPWAEASRAALDDDFNTAAVLGILAEAFTAANADADRKGRRSPAERAALALFARDARSVGSELGILQRSPALALRELRAKAVVRRGIDPARVEARIAERARARLAKDFARSDAVRDELLALGVTIQDGPSGTTWKVE
jgi:cysteinyl-tRNA synthetase